MDAQTIVKELNAHAELAHLVIDHNYLPSGNANVVLALNAIHKEIYGHSVNLYCGSCIADMFKKLYTHVKPQMEAKLTETKTEPNASRKTKKR